MTAPLLSPSAPVEAPSLNSFSGSAMARKRRRERLLSQRTALPDAALSSTNVPATARTEELSVPPKKRKVTNSDEVSDESSEFYRTESVTLESSLDVGSAIVKPSKKKMNFPSTAPDCDARNSKKLQKRYDPDVPMSKEEAAAWRREQRRKRNRESAAASRQRQRDRIAELEVELKEWKAKFANAMEKIRALEEAALQKEEEIHLVQNAQEVLRKLPTTVLDLQLTTRHGIVSPCSSPNLTPQQSPLSPSVTASALFETRRDQEGTSQNSHVNPVKVEEIQKLHLIETISRPA